MFNPFGHQKNPAQAFEQADPGLTPVAVRTILTGDVVWLLVALNLPSPSNGNDKTDTKEPNEAAIPAIGWSYPLLSSSSKRLGSDNGLSTTQPVKKTGKNGGKMRSFGSPDRLAPGSDRHLVGLSRAADNDPRHFVTIEQGPKNILPRGKFQGVK